jgi:hypothetical protein
MTQTEARMPDRHPPRPAEDDRIPEEAHGGGESALICGSESVHFVHAVH